MKLIITRHGETEENAQGIIQGHLPGTLSKLGIEQAERIANRLKDEKIDFIYSSDLARAADTAKKIAKFHPDTPLEFVKEIRERNQGEWQGKKSSEINRADPSLKKDVIGVIPLGGESYEQLYDRAKKFLDEVLHKHRNDTVLLVTHAGIGLALTCVITNKPLKDIGEIERLKNTSINIFEIDEEKNHKIILFNCTKHLA